jgi:outer membrane receptor protein involved in Fe transport
LNATAGVNSTQETYKQTGYTSTQQLVFGLLDHTNFITHDTKSENGLDLDYTSATRSYAVFAQAIVGYNDYLFFNLGGRNSWTSTLEADNRSLFYPSVSASFIPTSAIASLQNSKNVNYLKVRFGYGTSARFPDPYSTRSVLDINTRAFLDRNGTPINTNSINDLLANPDLKPELQKEIEAGLEGRFIDNRVSIDLTLYRRTTKDQILFRELDPSTGYTLEAINAGNVTNKGIELALGYTVIRNKDWTWHVDGLYDLNRSKVSDLPEDLSQVLIAGYTDLGNFAINGQPYGVIKSYYVVRDTVAGSKGFGQRVVDQTGSYLISSDQKVTGDPNPLYRLTGISTLTWKSLSFRMQWEFTEGGDYYSSTTVNLVGRGVTEETDFDRTLPMILPGVKQDGTPNDIQVSATAAYFNNLVGSESDLAIYDATLVRFREASLTWTLPDKWLSKTPFGAASLTFSGTNLWYYAPNFPKHVHFDPEAAGFGVSNGRGLEFFSGPSSRRIGGSLRITFK